MELKCQSSGKAAKRRTKVEEICNPQKEPKGCNLFYTHPDSTPLAFRPFFAAAMAMREARLCELREKFRRYETDKPFWFVAAYEAFERAFRVAESEQYQDKPQDNPLDLGKADKSKVKAFAAIIEQKEREELDEGLKGLAQLEKEFEIRPHLENDIAEYFRNLK